MASYDKRRKRWMARRRVDGRQQYRGSYLTQEEALSAERMVEGAGTRVPAARVWGGWDLHDQTDADRTATQQMLETLAFGLTHPKIETGHTEAGHPYAEATLKGLGRVRLTVETL